MFCQRKLHGASYYGSEEVASFVCEEYHHLLNERNNYGSTALHRAVFNNKLNIVKILCKYNIDINIKGNDGETAIDWGNDTSLPNM